MLFLFVPQESWDLQLRVFGYITYGLPRIFGYVLKVIKYSISVPLDRGGFGGWNLMLTTYFRQAAMFNCVANCIMGHPFCFVKKKKEKEGKKNMGRKSTSFIPKLKIKNKKNNKNSEHLNIPWSSLFHSISHFNTWPTNFGQISTYN